LQITKRARFCDTSSSSSSESECDSSDDERQFKPTKVTSEVDSSDDEKVEATVRVSYSRVGTAAAVASINRSYNNDTNQKALQLQRVARKK
jgi:hypothetical protein